MRVDDGDFEVLSTEEFHERLYGTGFYAPIDGELVFVSGDDAQRIAVEIAEQTGHRPEYVAVMCRLKRYNEFGLYFERQLQCRNPLSAGSHSRHDDAADGFLHRRASD